MENDKIATLGIRIAVNLDNDSVADIEKLFLGVMNYVNDLSYSVTSGSLNCERFFDGTTYTGNIVDIYNRWKRDDRDGE